MRLEDITIEHIDVMNKVIVLTGSIVGCAYLTELFIAWYGMNKFEICLHEKQGRSFQSIWMELFHHDGM
jgi:molybdopterin-containing oxidoreductase family membrane subunit